MRESELLEHIYRRSRRLVARHPQIAVGPGDDSAVVRAPPGGEWLITVDQLVEARHFSPGAPVERIARKIVARSVSDIAAMGGTTRGGWALATGALPEGFAKANELFDAMARWAGHWECPLIGGDIASTDERGRMVLTVTIAGLPHPVRGPVLRSTAKPGDLVYVTGALGGSFGSGRHLSFEPRLAEAAWLCEHLGQGGWGLHAMLDLSDGLGRDAARIASASGVHLRIEAGLLPLHRDAAAGGWRGAVSEGEDYELLFTAAPGIEVPRVCPATGTSITRIGVVLDAAQAPGEAPLASAADESGAIWDISGLGWDHS